MGLLRSACDPTAQAVRRSLLRDSRILLVTAGYPGEDVRRDYYECAHRLGVKLVLLETPEHFPPAAALIREGTVELGVALDLPLDFSTGSPVLAASLGRILTTVQANGPFDGVATLFEFGLPLSAWLAGQLGLPGNGYEVVARGRDKGRTREATQHLHLPTPRFDRITTAADLDPAAAHVRFPAILKPVSGLTSMEVHFVTGDEQLRVVHRDAVRRLEGNVHDNPGMLGQVTKSGGSAMILEEFLNGREFDVDFLLCGSELVYAGVTDNVTHPQWPWLLVRANMPSTLSASDTEVLVGETVRWTRALGYTDGAFHVEVKTTTSDDSPDPDTRRVYLADGTTPVLLEINARIGGASQYQLNKAAWGVDLVEEHLLNCVGIPIRPLVSPAPQRWYATQYLLAPRTGRVTNLSFIDDLKRRCADTDFLVCESWVKAGEAVRGDDPGPPSWVGEVTVGAESAAAAAAKLDALMSAVVISIY